MSIIDSFDNKSKPMFDIAAFYKKGSFGANVCIVSFSRHTLDMFLDEYKGQVVGHASTSNGDIDLYLFEVDGKKILFYMSPIGSCVASTILYEMHYISGATKFIVYGSCGVLDKQKCSGKLIVPSHSYRDEGLSYHYMAPSDYVEIKNCNKIAKIFDKHGFPYVIGKSWTTDAIFMETCDKVNARRNDGCISVEMESSGLQAICNYYGIDLYTFFFSGDLFDGDEWSKSDLDGKIENDIQKRTFKVALKVAMEL